MPILRPFRALRYDARAAGDLGAVLCPPYDVISPQCAQELRERHPYNAIHLEVPVEQPGDDEEARYRQAARELVAWRTEGILRKDRQPSIYVYESTARVPGSDVERSQLGFYCRLKLEPFAPESGVRPHEKTMSGPKEDRYRLLRATGANLSPVVGLYETRGGAGPESLDLISRGGPTVEACDDEGVRHRLWLQPVDDTREGVAAARLLELAGAAPVTIADGHHRYETALRYREERGRIRACESDPAYDYVMTLLFDAAWGDLTILPTHRLLRATESGRALQEVLAPLFEVQPLGGREELRTAFSADGPTRRNGGGSVGLWSGGEAAILRARLDAMAPLLDEEASQTLRWLDVNVLAAALEHALGIDAAATAAGAVGYTQDAAEALAAVDRGDYDAAFLLDPTPVSAVLAVAAAGEVMPQKSTYFYPKAATGLAFYPLEA